MSSKYQCGHIQGSLPYRCEYAASDCEHTCTLFSWCVAYSTDGNMACELVSSSGLCPNGWAHSNGPVAASSDELVPSGFAGFSCMAKVNGI